MVDLSAPDSVVEGCSEVDNGVDVSDEVVTVVVLVCVVVIVDGEGDVIFDVGGVVDVWVLVVVVVAIGVVEVGVGSIGEKAIWQSLKMVKIPGLFLKSVSSKIVFVPLSITPVGMLIISWYSLL